MFHFYLQNSPKLVLTQRESSFTAKCSINLHPCRQGDQLGKLEIKSCCSCRGCFVVGEAALRCLNNTLRNYRLAHAHTFPSLKHLNSNLLRLGKKCNSPFCAKQVPFRIVVSHYWNLSGHDAPSCEWVYEVWGKRRGSFCQKNSINMYKTIKSAYLCYCERKRGIRL